MQTSNRLAALAIAASAFASSAHAQGIIPDVIGATMANMNGGLPEHCLDGSWEPTPEQAARFTAEAEPALRAYLALAATDADLRPAYDGDRHELRWSIDGQESGLAVARDPWAAHIARLELIGLRLGGTRVRGRGLWRAYAADGTALGIYDGLFRRKSRGFGVTSLDLFSPGAVKQPAALTGFCYTPGDTEAFRETRARREADRAARRAARDAQRSAAAAAPR
jgi:hypothetical protein